MPKKKMPLPQPNFTSRIGPPPAVLQGHALVVWHEVVRELELAGIGSKIENHALSCYAQAISDFHACQGEIDRLGLVVQTERGTVRNPAATLKNQAMLLIHKFGSAFGLTPLSRGRVSQGSSSVSKDQRDSQAILESNPEGYARYLAEHGVPPTNEFAAFY